MGMADARGLVTVSPVGSYKAEALPRASLTVKGCGAIHLTSHILGFLAQPQPPSALCLCHNRPRGCWMGSSTYCRSSTLYGGCIRQSQAKCNRRLCRRLYVCSTAARTRRSLHVVTDNSHRGPLEIVGISRTTRLAELLWVTSEFQR